MKKIYVLFLAVGTIWNVTAQSFEKGDKLLGGSLGYSLNKSTYAATSTYPGGDSRYVSVSISPTLGFFTKTNRLSGLSLQFGYASNLSGNSNVKDRLHSYGAGFYRQYWSNLGKSFYFIIQGQTGLNYTDYFSGYTSGIQNYQTKGLNTYLSTDPGFAYRIKRRLVLDVYYSNFVSVNFGYYRRERNGVEESKTYGFSASTGLRNFSLDNFIFGFRYLL